MSVIIEKRTKTFLIISGLIDVNKRIEFEHTFRIGFNSMSGNCLVKAISEDRNTEGLYYFLSIWSNEESLKIFIESTEFQLLNGAFHALGKVTQVISGNISDLPFNHFSKLDLKNNELN